MDHRELEAKIDQVTRLAESLEVRMERVEQRLRNVEGEAWGNVEALERLRDEVGWAQEGKETLE